MKPTLLLILFSSLIFSQNPSDIFQEPIIKVHGLKKGSKKDQLLQKIEIKDVIIYDLDYYNDLVFAVGEDNSFRIKEQRKKDDYPYVESIIIRSEDGGKSWKKTGLSNDIPHKKVFVLDENTIVIGSSKSHEGDADSQYQGKIIVSHDSGFSWKVTANGALIDSLKKTDDKSLVVNIYGDLMRSHDGGMTWHNESSSNQSKKVKTFNYQPENPIIKIDGLSKGSKKEQLLQMINVKDVVIYDLDYHNNLVIAVGKDNSPRVRELASTEPYYESIILRSEDGGKTWKKTGQSNFIPHDRVIVLNEKNVVVSSSMEGNGGNIYASSDGGYSWKHTYSEGMTESFELIGDKVFVIEITGRIYVSSDGGIDWAETSWSDMVNHLYEKYKDQPKDVVKKELMTQILVYTKEEKYNSSVPYLAALDKLVESKNLPKSFNFIYAKSILRSNRLGYDSADKAMSYDTVIIKLQTYLKEASKDEKFYKSAEALLEEAYYTKE